VSKKSGYSGPQKRQALEGKRVAVSITQNDGLMELFAAMEKQTIKAGMQAKTPQEREDMWSKLRGLYALYAELKMRIEIGTALEKADQAAGQVSEERQSPARTPLS